IHAPGYEYRPDGQASCQRNVPIVGYCRAAVEAAANAMDAFVTTSGGVCVSMNIPPGYELAANSGVYVPGDPPSPQGRTRVDAAIFREPRTAVLFILGQSNAGNYGETLYTPTCAVYNFNILDGHYYPAQDPLLGATGDGGSPWGILGDELIAHGLAARVLL